MRLIGVSFAGVRLPLSQGYLPLGRVTGLVGGNDTGKSQLLDLVTAALSGRQHPGSTVFFVACSPAEFAALTVHALKDVTLTTPGSAAPKVPRAQARAGRRDTWFNGPVAGADLDSARISSTAQIRDWARALKDAAGENAQPWSIIVEATIEAARRTLEGESTPGPRQSPVMGFEPSDEGGSRGWNLFWCLPSIQRLPTVVTAALRELGKSRSSDDPGLMTPWTVRDREGSERDLGPFLQDYFDPAHRRVAAAPIPAVPVGRIELDLLPAPVALPLELAEAKATISERVETIVQRLDWADEALADVKMGNTPDARLSSVNDAWLFTEGLSEGLSSYAGGVLKSLIDTANELLPDWLSDRYLVDLRPTRPHRMAEEGRFQLMLRTTDEKPVSFPVDDLASGHRLWVQLALFEAVERIRQWTQFIVFEIESAAAVMETDFKTWQEGDEYPSREVLTRLEECERLIGDRLHGRIPEPMLTAGPAADVSWLAALPESSLAPMSGVLQPRLYVIDEPERHLHPSAQRRSARWVPELLESHGSGALIATHSPAFMALDGAVYTYVFRVDGGPAHLEPINPSEWTRLSIEASELGLDRGELLTLIRVLLWVEGRHDVAVLEALFPEELRRSGIAVVPVHGYSRSSGILDAEVLLRFTVAKAAVWLDRVPREVADALLEDPEAADRVLAERERYSSETQQAAKLVSAARKSDREIEILPHPGDDVLDLLSDEVITGVCPRYPGHARAAEELQAAGVTSGDRRKRFLAERYEFRVTPPVLGEIAQRMRERGTCPPPLREVMDRCERLSRSLD